MVETAHQVVDVAVSVGEVDDPEATEGTEGTLAARAGLGVNSALATEAAPGAFERPLVHRAAVQAAEAMEGSAAQAAASAAAAMEGDQVRTEHREECLWLRFQGHVGSRPPLGRGRPQIHSSWQS